MKKISLIITLIFSIVLYAYIFYTNFFILDELFLPDDTYYTLTIAKNMANGCPPSMDCETVTSGFQPLITLFLIPIFLVTENIFFPIYYAIIISIFFGILSNIISALIFYKFIKSFYSALIFYIFLTTHNYFIDNNFNGLETSLSSFLCLLAIYLLLKTKNKYSYKWYIILGIIIGLGILARIDSSLVAFYIGCYLLWKFGLRKTLITITSAFFIVLPIWAYNFIHLKSIIPESGKAVKLITEYHQNTYLTNDNIIKKSLAALNFFEIKYLLVISLLAIIVSTIFIGIKSVKSDKLTILFFTVIASYSIFFLYTFYLPAYWFFHRYFNLVHFLFIISVFVSIFYALKLKYSYFVIFIALIINIIDIQKYFNEPNFIDLYEKKGAKGYARVAIEINSNIPDTSNLAAMQSGALTYFKKNNQKILNLDGVVNGEILTYIKNHNIDDYLKSNDIIYFSDWYFNRVSLIHLSKNNSIYLKEIRHFPLQGKDHFTLYKIRFNEYD